nr:Asp-tRNA(Asn)/Glu-tRNA(Gln) amidotransferase subunit GatC [SAR86 cluster bacterium]
DLEEISYLARINVQEEDFSSLKKELEKILKLIGKMNDADTDGIKAMSHPLDLFQPLRSDEVTEIDERDKLLASAPSVKYGLFVVPKVIDEGK